MKTGIIGAGNIGSALTRRFTAAGHQVFVANSRRPQTLTKLAAETGAKPVSVKEAQRRAGEPVIDTELSGDLRRSDISRRESRARHAGLSWPRRIRCAKFAHHCGSPVIIRP
jgi:3-hydroxyisobutyrate dehydrogenase-like beta-hydroxyacid dehydrogenase